MIGMTGHQCTRTGAPPRVTGPNANSLALAADARMPLSDPIEPDERPDEWRSSFYAGPIDRFEMFRPNSRAGRLFR